MNLTECIEKFLDTVYGTVSPRTITWYRNRLTPLKEISRDISAVTLVDLEEVWSKITHQTERWVNHPHRKTRAGKLSSFSLNGYIRTWRVFFNWCVTHEHCKTNPALQLRLAPLPDQPPKAISEADLKRMLKVARSNPRDHALVCFLADTGCRVSAMVGLRYGDLQLDDSRAVVHEKGRGGQGKSHTVYLTPRTVKALTAYLATCPEPESEDAPVFHSIQPNHDPLTPLLATGVSQLLERLAKKAGVTGRYNPHAFRHGFARGAIKNGADLATVSQLLGHSDVAITAKFYTRWTDAELQARHAQTSWLPAEDDQDETQA